MSRTKRKRVEYNYGTHKVAIVESGDRSSCECCRNPRRRKSSKKEKLTKQEKIYI